MTYGDAGRRLSLARRLYGTEREYSRRPYGVVITSTNPRRDQMTFEGPRAGRTIPIAHPYLGPNSWIRIMPERTTRLIINSRADSGEPFGAAYLAEASSQGQLDATYESNQFYYRRLREGEISMASPGIAEQHLARGGTMSLRAGPLTHVMSVERLDITSKAPTVITQALDNHYDQISSETRFGVVKRRGADSTQDKYIQVTPTGTSDPIFAKEYLRNVSCKATPFILVDHREGHVVDDSGEEETSVVTGKKLRARTRWSTKDSQDSVWEVDEEGNYNIKLPGGASYGFNLEVERTDAKVIVGRDEMHTIGRNLLFDVTETATVEARNIEMTAQQNISMEALIQIMQESVDIQMQGTATIGLTSAAITLAAGQIAMATTGGGGGGGSFPALIGPGADTGSVPGASGLIKAEPMVTVLDPLGLTGPTAVASQAATVAGFAGSPLAPSIPVFTSIIAYIVALQAQLASSATTSLGAL